MRKLNTSRLWIIVGAILMSTGGTGIKLADLSIWQIACFRSGIAAVFLYALIPHWRQIANRRAWFVGMVYGVTMLLYVASNRLTTAANSIFLQTSAPLYILVAGPILLKEQMRKSDIWMVALLAVGVSLFFFGGNRQFTTAPNPALGNILATVSGITWAMTIMGLRWLGRDQQSHGPDPTGAAVIIGNFLVFCVCLPFVWPITGLKSLDWGCIGYLGIIQIGLAYFCIVRGVRGTKAVEVSLLFVIEPVLNSLLSWAVHGEVPGPGAMIGACLIITGVVAVALRPSSGEYAALP